MTESRHPLRGRSIPVSRRPWHRWEVYVRWHHGTDQHLGYAVTRRGALRARHGMDAYRVLSQGAFDFRVRRVG